MHKEKKAIEGKVNTGAGIRIIALKKTEKKKAKTVVLVSKKIEKKAFCRNLTKRRTREAVFIFKKQNSKLKNISFVVLVKTPHPSFKEISQVISEHFKNRPYYV